MFYLVVLFDNLLEFYSENAIYVCIQLMNNSCKQLQVTAGQKNPDR